MADSNINNKLILDDDQRKGVIDALLIGLESYGEIERLTDAVRMMDFLNEPLPKKVRPIHPTGSADTVGVFASALRYLQE